MLDLGTIYKYTLLSKKHHLFCTLQRFEHIATFFLFAPSHCLIHALWITVPIWCVNKLFPYLSRYHTHACQPDHVQVIHPKMSIQTDISCKKSYFNSPFNKQKSMIELIFCLWNSQIMSTVTILNYNICVFLSYVFFLLCK